MRLVLPSLLWLAALACPALPAAAAGTDTAALTAQYAARVDKRLQIPASEVQHYGALAQQALRAAGVAPLLPQYLVLVDRSPQVQALLLLWLAPEAEPVLIGASPVSTGRTGDYDYFETPTGVFEHSPAHHDFRSEGTPNGFGVRGFGAQGLRVFDFGWQPGRRGWGAGGISPMRLLLHATDPELLEPLLGSVQSKGCNRAPATLIRLLDQFGPLDAAYEDAARNGEPLWVLAPQRTPVAGAGRYLVIVDSGRRERPAWAPRPARRP